MTTPAPPSWPLADPDVMEALRSCYQDGSWGKYAGVYHARLTERLAAYFGVPHVVLCGSGTYAVELALRALLVGPGDEVALAAYDYPGNFLSIHALGAHPVLVDLDHFGWQLSVESLREALSPQTQVVIASHLHGGLVPMREVMALAAERNFRVIEDAAQCPGAIVQGRRAGTWGDVGILSFGGSKLLTAGRGGAVITHDAGIHHRAGLAQQRGNIVCPLSELQAAVLLPQLDKLDARNAQRWENVQRLAARLGDWPILRLFSGHPPESRPAFYKVGFQFDPQTVGLSHEAFTAWLRNEGVAFDPGFRALHIGRSPRRYRRVSELREASRAHEGAVVLHHPVLLGNPEEIDAVADRIIGVCRATTSGPTLSSKNG